jgi:hypothetical protein
MPHAFTESGVAMLSSVLNSERAVSVNIQIIRAFIRLRYMIGQHEVLRLTIKALEQRTNKNERDIQLALNFLKKILFPANRNLPRNYRKMGFVQDKNR